MHQLGHSRAHSMQDVQFSSNSAITPRVRGGSSGFTSGYCAVTARCPRVFAVTRRPSTSPFPGSSTPPPPPRRLYAVLAEAIAIVARPIGRRSVEQHDSCAGDRELEQRDRDEALPRQLLQLVSAQ